MNFIFEVFSVLTKFKKRNKLVGLAFANAVLEIFSLASLLSLIALFFSPEEVNARYTQDIKSVLAIQSQTSFIVIVTILFLIFFLIKTILSLRINRVIAKDIFKISEDISTHILKKYLRISYVQFTHTNFAAELNRMVYLPFTFSSNLLFPALTVASECIILFALLLALAFFKISAFLVAVLIAAPLFFVFTVQKRKIEEVDNGIRRDYPSLIKQAMRILEGLPEIKSFQKGSFFNTQYSSAAKSLSRSFATHYTLQHQSSKLSELVAALGISVLILYAAILLHPPEAVILIGLYAGASFRIIPSINRILSALVQIKSQAFILEEFSKIKVDEPVRSPTAINFTHTLAFENIIFSYPDRPSVLNNLSFKIKKGEKIIITGRSGSGKTTFMLLLLGLLKPTSGKISVDAIEKPIDDLEGFRDIIGYVPQNPILIDGTLAENIAFGILPENIDPERINQLVAQLDLHSLLLQLPFGIQTTIGEKGIQLSGGQRQRLAIARALYTNPELILLDEITSHLDDATEKEVIKVLKKLTDLNKTIILISHQNSLIEQFDRHLIMDNGRLIEKAALQNIA